VNNQTNPDPNTVFLPSAKVRARYGVSAMTLHRWLKDPGHDFPQPIRIGNRRYWRLSDLEEFERRRAGRNIRGRG
jgi:predicted DNA-binding transcriptional regulator AlpA